MSEITVTIDGQVCKATEGETILNIARANNIFIPAICYLTRCSPTLACRLCLVEADGKQVYACNVKAKDGMSVQVTTENIQKERRAIMQVYDINHPLECGVCDQSGQCELQNYTLGERVDCQEYATKPVHKPVLDWGHMNYDASLCIVCERCVTVCKDMVGDNALKTVKRGADALDVSYKDSMPKDAYAMWNKLNKSIIGSAINDDAHECSACGECIAVCPVGALVSSDFQYTSNAWELSSVPATCTHCSNGCMLYYDVKHENISNSENKIYRVKNEFHYRSLCGAGRFGYDFENRVESKNEVAFEKALQAFKKADSVIFSSYITNEEAYILQKLKEKYGFKLVNEDAFVYKRFLAEYAKYKGQNLYNISLEDIHTANFVVSLGSALRTDSPISRFAFNNAIKMNKGAGIYFHPVKDSLIEGISKNLLCVNHKAGLEEAALYLLLDLFADKSKLPEDVKLYLEGFHSTKTETITETIKEKVVEIVKELVKDEESGEEKEVEKEVSKMVPKKVQKEIEVDVNALLTLLDAPANFTEVLEKNLKKKDNFKLLVGEDVYNHPHYKNIAALLAAVEEYTPFEILIIPSKTNTLGVSLLCDLDESASGYSVGYNVAADFTLSALGEGDLDMPALNQQEGTFTSADRRVLPTNVAVPYKGYVLNDIANALGLHAKYTIDYTPYLPEEKGFKAIAFDNLGLEFSNAGEDLRGYALKAIEVEKTSISLKPIEMEKGLEGQVVYRCNPILQFSPFTNKAHQLHKTGGLYISNAYAKANELTENDEVYIELGEKRLKVSVRIDTKIDGDIVYLPTFDTKINTQSLISDYRFVQAKVVKA